MSIIKFEFGEQFALLYCFLNIFCCFLAVVDIRSLRTHLFLLSINFILHTYMCIRRWQNDMPAIYKFWGGNVLSHMMIAIMWTFLILVTHRASVGGLCQPLGEVICDPQPIWLMGALGCVLSGLSAIDLFASMIFNSR